MPPPLPPPLTQESREPPDLPSSSALRKRKVDEIADSQDEDEGMDSDEEYGWANDEDAGLIVDTVASGL